MHEFTICCTDVFIMNMYAPRAGDKSMSKKFVPFVPIYMHPEWSGLIVVSGTSMKYLI
jgi:hypothetical protein